MQQPAGLRAVLPAAPHAAERHVPQGAALLVAAAAPRVGARRCGVVRAAEGPRGQVQPTVHAHAGEAEGGGQGEPLTLNMAQAQSI